MKIENQLAKIKKLENPPQWTECEKRIMAWSIDWEGSIIIGRKNTGFLHLFAEVTITNTNKKLLLKFKEIAKLGKIYKTKKKPPCKDRWNWRVTTINECRYLLQNIRPYLHAKKEQAKLVLRFLESRINRGIKINLHVSYSEKEKNYRKQIKQLNKRGRPIE